MFSFFHNLELINYLFFNTFFITTSICFFLTGRIICYTNTIETILTFLLFVIVVVIMLLQVGVEFFSITYLFIYLGGIVVVFLFAAMTVDFRMEDTVRFNSLSKLYTSMLFNFFLLYFSISTQFFSLKNELIESNFQTKYELSNPFRTVYSFYLKDYNVYSHFLYTTYGPHLIFISIFLLITLICSISLCLHYLRQESRKINNNKL